MKRCYIFDIDGTVADCSHRLQHIEKDPKDWEAFYSGVHLDKPIQHVIDLARLLSRLDEVIFVTGRSADCRAATMQWLHAQGFQPGTRLLMRPSGDHRPDHIVKSELLSEILAEGFFPVMAFEDRSSVVKMWRARGVPCAQVAEGDF
ncbi:MAG TPA: HAD family acid phosphatase [Rhizomicrobium sp.]